MTSGLLYTANPLNLVKLFYSIFFSKDRHFFSTLHSILGFYPRNIDLYRTAFTHRSASRIDNNGNYHNNERLEYLGDAILGVIIAEYLFKEFPEANEGFLTQMRSKIVNGEKLTELAKNIGISSLIVANTSSSRNVRNLYGDAFEAFIGAIYLDLGFYRTKHFVLNRLLKRHINIPHLEQTETNFKSKLIEWAQKYKHEVAFYTDLESANSKYFVSYVHINNEQYGSGYGRSKKEAEQKAAKETLAQVENHLFEVKVTEDDFE